MTSPLLFITDRTSIETDWKCGAMLWWYKYHQGKGIVPKDEEEHFLVGRDIHEDMEGFPLGKGVEDILSTLPSFESCEGDQFKLEILCRRRGWVIAFGEVVWPYLMQHYTVEAVEKELVFDRSPLWIQVKPDLVLRNKKTGRLVYIEYKSTASLSPKFTAHWDTAIQLHLGIAALEEELGEKVEFGQVIGFNKGTWRGRLIHPFVWGYRNSETGEVQVPYKYGLDHYPAWEYHSHDEWVRQLAGREALEAQFGWSAPVFKNDHLINKIVERRLVREEEIWTVKDQCQGNEEERNKHFEMRPIHCLPSFGSGCVYSQCCFNESVGKDPIGSGLYIERTPHHELDVIGVE